MNERLFAIEVWLNDKLAVTSYDKDLEGAKEVAQAWVRDEQRYSKVVEVKVYEMTLLATYGTGPT